MLNSDTNSFVITNNTLFKQYIVRNTYPYLMNYDVKQGENVWDSTNNRMYMGDTVYIPYCNWIINSVKSNYIEGDVIINNYDGITFIDQNKVRLLPYYSTPLSTNNKQLTWVNEYDDILINGLNGVFTRNNNDWYINDDTLILSSNNGSYFVSQHTYINYYIKFTNEQKYFEIRGPNYRFSNFNTKTNEYSDDINTDKYGKIYVLIKNKWVLYNQYLYTYNDFLRLYNLSHVDYILFEPSNNNLNLFKGCIRYSNDGINWTNWCAVNFDAYNKN